jgi:hypothetical protein
VKDGNSTNVMPLHSLAISGGTHLDVGGLIQFPKLLKIIVSQAYVAVTEISLSCQSLHHFGTYFVRFIFPSPCAKGAYF